MKMDFSALLLAGGQSRRMGRDKALLPLPDGQPLWRRQFAVLEALEPREIFLSGPPREGFPAALRLLDDEAPGLGPLAGLVAALRVMRSPSLVVLAVDLPAMQADYLARLCALSRPGCGVAPRRGEFHEPLAAVYPRDCLALAEERLHGADRSLQAFVRLARQAGLVQSVEVAETELPMFVNWNSPADCCEPASKR